MVSDWIIISAMLVLGAVVVLFLRAGNSDEMPTNSGQEPGSGK